MSIRTELLLAAALPTQLIAHLGRILSLEDRPLALAVAKHFRRFHNDLHFLENLDFSAVHKELYRLAAIPTAKLSKATARRSTKVAWQASSYADAYVGLNTSYFSLVAAAFLAGRQPRTRVLEDLTEQSWSTKHEILSRLVWMQEHRRLIQKGVQLRDPYSCQVARRGNHARRVDREFYQLIGFLHGLKAAEGTELLVVSKNETPDFLLEDSNHVPIGAEMTEASISDEWDAERDAEECVLDVIGEEIQGLPLRAHISTPPSWRELVPSVSKLRDTLQEQLQNLPKLTKDGVLLPAREFLLEIQLFPCKPQRGYISVSNHRGIVGSEIRHQSSLMQKTLRERIEKKVAKKSGQQKKRPSIRPCHLVIYPQGDFSYDLEQAVRAFFESPPVAVKSHFDAVWLSGEKTLVRLV